MVDAQRPQCRVVSMSELVGKLCSSIILAFTISTISLGIVALWMEWKTVHGMREHEWPPVLIGAFVGSLITLLLFR